MQSVGQTLDWLFPKKPAAPPVAPTTTPDWFTANAPPAAPPSTDTNIPMSDLPGMNNPQSPGAPAYSYTPGLTPGGPAGQWDQNSFAANFGRPGTPQELAALEPKLKAAGIKVLRNAAGVAGKIQLADGTIVDIINSAGAGGNGFQWLTGGGGSGGGGSIGLGDFGSLAQGWDKQFVAPTVDQIRATPGYEFARSEGISALDKSAAARGTLLGGGQKKDIMTFATGLADQTAQQSYQNAVSEYMNAYNIARNNSNDIFGRFDTLSNRGTQAAVAATG